MSQSYPSSTEFVIAEKQGPVLTLTLNRPDALNALRPEMLTALADLLALAGQDESLAVVVLAGAGRAFSAGVDLKVLQGIEPVGGVIGNVFDEPAQRMSQTIRDLPLPVIARVHGACFTGALEIALHCDFIYTTTDAKFGDTHTKFGLRPSWGMAQTLSRAVGVRRARELSFSAQTFSGAQAAEWGLANAAFDTVEALDAALAACCERIAGNSRGAVSVMKDLYAIAAAELGLETSLATEAAHTYDIITDTNERLAAFK